MSPQLSARCVLAVLAASLLASGLGLLALGPVALRPSAAPAWSTLHNGSALLVILAAGWAAARSDQLRRRPWRQAWRNFFRIAALAAVLALFDGAAATELGGRLARMAAGSACALVALIFLAERLGPRWIAPRPMLLALLAGPAAALIGFAAQALHGQPDARLLLWLEALPLLLLPLGVWGLSSRGLAGGDWLLALGGYLASKLLAGFDAEVLAASGGGIDGASAARWLVAGTLGWLGWRLLGRQPLRAVGAGSSSAPNTSANTSG
ncbi:MAG TPA: hypothetical protein VFR90_07645 [Methylibium sp.]|uniref:hypothetical protein n=1 Tax=Methylibium sp. TaxID=2067992 RepID=UPI002DB879EB|nr:hypothetical protein [Methylibium sp.]HEU4458980.1 hypothetical protein [Methylibium sp.]